MIPQPEARVAVRLPALRILGFLLLATLAASAAPLTTYALSLGAFGLVHVLAEVRYVDERFRRRLHPGLVLALLIGLGLIVLWRTALMLDDAAGNRAAQVELALVVALALVALAALRRAGAAAAVVGAAVTVILVAGAWHAPLLALVVLAVLHNLTPVGFLAERLRGPARIRALRWCMLAFVAVPVLIASGALRGALGRGGLTIIEDPLWGVGSIEQHLGVFVPAGLQGGPAAVDLFAAVVYLQVLHYAVVIHVLPRLGAGERERSAWPAPSVFARLLGIVAAVSLVAFALSFGEARRAYGVFAAFHAWLEVPILMLALGGAAVLREQPA